ncbi:MAG: hypothetical protein DRN81_04755, partial [Thermoproteota archaeon]
LGMLYREGTDLHIISAGQIVKNYAHLDFWKDISINGKFQRSSGMLIAETGTRNFSLTSGVVYAGLTPTNIASFDSSGADTFTYYYRDGSGGWTKVTSQSQIDNTQYDDGSGSLATLSNNQKRGVHWVYQDIDGHVFVLYGQGNYTSAQAQDAQPPASVPQLIADVGGLVGKIIIKKNQPVFETIQSAFTQDFSPSVVIDHSDLSSLQGGTTDEYYHLTSSEYTELNGWLDDVTLGSSGALTLPTGQNFTIGTTQWNTGDDIDASKLSGTIPAAVLQTEWDSAYTHISSDGSDHTYINQSVTTSASPTFAYVTLSNSPTGGSHATTKDYVDNLVQGLDWQESVKDIVDNTSAPPTEVSGDRYLLDATAGGVHADWDGASVNDIVEFNGSTWDVSYDASTEEGGSTWVEDEDINYTWNGTAWVKFGSTVTHNNTSGLQGGTSNEYYHLTSAQHTVVGNTSGTNTGDEASASTTVAGVVELATTAETTTGTDATRAVTPDGLKDGYQGSTNVTTLGTIATGTWQGSVIDHERGGLEADVSAYDGIVKISGGATSAITDNSTNWDTAYTHSQDNTQAHSDYLLNSGDDSSSGRITAAGFTSSEDIVANKNIQLAFEPSSDDTSSGLIISATVDSNSTGVGCPLYMAADGHFDEADADDVTTAPALAIAIETGTGTKKVLLQGIIRNDGWNWTTGPGESALIFLSTTVGTLTQTAPSATGEVVQVVGYALSDDVMYWNPQLHVIEHV